MKTFFAVRICVGIGADGTASVCACNTTDEIIANPRNATESLTLSMIASFLCLS
jgi:hypothetical protein